MTRNPSLRFRACALAPLVAALLLWGASPAAPASAEGGPPLVAVLPVYDVTGGAAPLEDLRSWIEESLASRGVAVLDAARLDEVLRAARVRHTGGVTDEMAEVFRDRAGVRAVLVTSLLAYDPSEMPRVALDARLVSVEGASPWPVWAGGAALAGDDAPGAFDLGVVRDIGLLASRAVDDLAEGLGKFLEAGAQAKPLEPPRAEGRFRPRSLYVAASAPVFGSEVRRVAVLPFLNDTTRRNAGEAVAIQFVRALVEMGGVEVIEPGRVRKVLLDTRLVQEDGVSHAQADIIRGIVEADLVITGRVTEFREDPGGGTPFVEFGAYGLDAAKRQVAWLARTHAEGWKGAPFFGLGQVRSAAKLSEELTRAMLREVVRRSGRPKK